MREKKDRRRRRAYLDDIRLNEEGRYSYQGVCYQWEAEGKTRRRALTELTALGIVMAACAVAAGCIPAPGMGNCVYLVLPYAAQVIAAVSVCWTLARLCAGGDPVREYVYQATVEKLPGRTAAEALCGVLVLAGETVYLLLNGAQGAAGMCVLLFILETAGLAAALGIRRSVQGLTWKKV